MNITLPKPLRAKKLQTPALNKVGGGRGTCCGVYVHCDNCGGLTYNALAYCGMRAWYGTSCSNCGAPL